MKNLRFKLLLSLITFAIIIVSVVSFANRQMLISDIVEQENAKRELIEKHILSDMQAVDSAHYYFDRSISLDMENQLRAMVEKYEQEPDVINWNLAKMQESTGMEYFILDDTNTVIKTTFDDDIGLSFSECCKKFSALLHERRESGQFFSDGMDVSTKTGEIMKYSYLGTPDKKYLLEAGINVNAIPVFQEFNFVRSANKLMEKYDDLQEVRILNSGGIFLNDSEVKEVDAKISVEEMPNHLNEAFTKARKTMKAVEYEKKLQNGYIETYRFLPYEAEINRGESTRRVIYIKYDNSNELALLKQNLNQFWLLLLISLVIAFLTLVVIIRILTKTINLATYDVLTKIYNRATYINKMEELLAKCKHKKIGLILVDLDNFKKVNDQFGHTQGDKVLIGIAKLLERTVRKEGFVARFGGDEFTIVVYDASEKKLEKIANHIISEVHRHKNNSSHHEIWEPITVSIGSALVNDMNETEVSLFSRADQALYRSKSKGKNCYSN